MRISDFFNAKQSLAGPYGRQYAALWSGTRRACEGGKKFRPALVVNAYHALGGKHDEDVVVVATAFELLHTAFLLHDDVIDGDTMRRGQPNLLGAFSAHAADRGVNAASATVWGEASAILAGDLLIHAAQAQIARLDIAAGTRCALLELLEECMFVTAAGELADVAFSTTVELPVFSEVLSMTQWKTAHYSFQAPLRAGAILAGAGEVALTALGEYGRHIGIAFQLRDDILGIFGAEDVTGKSTTSDLREHKMTALMCYALQRDDTGELHEILGRERVTDSDLQRVKNILAGGARAFIETLIADQTQLAIAAIDSSAIPAGLGEQLVDVARKACERAS
ncbi:polyprenyl synthetase family protein [Rathayibacter soli]|uniref:polyprenyl synthetase family protein n=1 Tax=Rathayibacter soli TaxID=3144168 RepID=UPI0027E41E4D|nr:polyprenyl synthetase family protein [Glaciibacter superstes]